MEKQQYIVTVNSSYVRDIQIFYPEKGDNLSQIEDLHSCELSNRWCEINSKDLFLGHFVWEKSEDELLDHVTELERLPKEILKVTKIK